MTIDGTASLKLGAFPGFADGIGKKAKSGAFTDALKDAAEKKSGGVRLSGHSDGGFPLITESGKSSKGDKTLTEEQKQYLRDKYHLSNLSESDFDSLTAELTNMGALSYQDFKMKHLTLAMRKVGDHWEPARQYSKESEELRRALAASNHYLQDYQQMVQDEQQGTANVQGHTGFSPSQDQGGNDCAALAHQRIAKLLESLL